MQDSSCGAVVADQETVDDVVSRGAAAVHAAGDSSAWLNPAVRYVFFAFVERPLLQVYLYGPSFNGYGCWAGLEPAGICTAVTNVPVDHWREHHTECAELVYHRFESYMVVVYAGMYFTTLAQLATSVWRWFKCRH